MKTKILLACGMVATLHYAAMNAYIPLLWSDYDVVSQTVSELSAVGAPTRTIWVSLALPYTLLVIAFGYGIRRVAGENMFLRITGMLIILHSLVGLWWPPMHQRMDIAAGKGSLTDTLHIVFTMVTVMFFIAEIVLSALAMGRSFRIFSFIMLGVMLFFGILTSREAPGIESGMPTPMIGIWERINIGAYMIWMAVLSIMLLKKQPAVSHPGIGMRIPS